MRDNFIVSEHQHVQVVILGKFEWQRRRLTRIHHPIPDELSKQIQDSVKLS
jgi:hypothetical protein